MNPIGATAADADAAWRPRRFWSGRFWPRWFWSRWFWSRWSWMVIPLIVLLAVTLPKLNQGDWRGDTGWYAALGLDAARSGRWTLSAGDGEPYFNKPPLVFWIVGRTLDWFGVDLLVARLTSVLAAALGVVATAGIARDLGSRRLGAIAGVVLALTYEYFRRTREISLDMWHAAFLLLGAWAMVKGALAGGGHGVPRSSGLDDGARDHQGADTPVAPRQPVRAALHGSAFAWFMLAGVPIGLALLTKPLIALAAAPIMAAWLWHVRGTRHAGFVCVSLLVGVGIALPWHLWMTRTFGDSFLDQYFGREIAARASGRLVGGQKATQPAWYYLAQIAGGYWPWLIALAAAIFARAWRSPAGLLSFLWAGAWLVLLTAFPDRRDRYAIPVYPGLAIASALGLLHLCRGIRRRALNGAMRLAAPVSGVLAIIVALLPIRVQSKPDEQWTRLEEFLRADGAPGVLYEGACDGAPAARVFLITGAWPIPTRDAADRSLASPARGSLFFYHARGGRAPGPGESIVFSAGDLSITRLDADAWNPGTIADPGE
ncbi:MAG: glycosyltransferase family 39 protein [Phycisphaerae bacterium]|nr:glycosyltransferase family 39 protein [Phycisphaerae bacterium]